MEAFKLFIVIGLDVTGIVINGPVLPETLYLNCQFVAPPELQLKVILLLVVEIVVIPDGAAHVGAFPIQKSSIAISNWVPNPEVVNPVNLTFIVPD